MVVQVAPMAAMVDVVAEQEGVRPLQTVTAEQVLALALIDLVTTEEMP
jgi:hypothetical protein